MIRERKNQQKLYRSLLKVASGKASVNDVDRSIAMNLDETKPVTIELKS